MTTLWVLLGISLAISAAIVRNTDELCREAKGIALGLSLSTAMWILIIILVRTVVR